MTEKSKDKVVAQTAEFEVPANATHGVFIYDTADGKPMTVPWGDANLGQMFRLLMDRFLIIQGQATAQHVMDAMMSQAMAGAEDLMKGQE